MESFMPYLLSLLLLRLSLYLISFVRKKGKNLPPGCNSWVRENLSLNLIGSRFFFQHRMQKYSPAQVFKTSIFGVEAAVFCGAQGNKFLFTNETKLVSAWRTPSLRKALLPAFVANNKKNPVAIFRSYDLAKPDALRQYIPVMDAVVRRLLPERPNSVVKMLPLSNKYSFELAFKLFTDAAVPEVLEKLIEPFGLLVDGMLALPINLPGTTFSRAVKAGQVARAEVMRMVKERRKEMRETGEGEGEGRDMLSKMLLLSDEDEEYDTMVANFVVGLVVVSYDSTASAITAVVHFLAELPHIYQQVLREQMEIAKSKGPDEPLTWEDMEKMKYSWNVARESLRLLPPAVGGFKEATTDFTYAGYTIPKGYKTYWTPHSSHMNPEYFPEPEKFEPSRFEGSGPPPYTFVPFGGGPRMCAGKDYARVAILVFMHNLVTRFRLEKVIPDEKMVFHATRAVPAHGLPIHLHPHSN
ncbi:beta-amyrin 6-beta-monooxygenase-like [Salvia miltiorrhiza]|uniref:beta-amyrin 6-beta-monooxygenase-like n=1 Tax=Salvia miltiorrhiza TaxID=226208 RepID=UPI0025ABC60A|nr:beta-amyrin 6-beta-monooxygenase-like [Salvia miltiorrhiza]